jgi:hypothetical protein
MKEAFMTRMGSEDAKWIAEQAEVFGSRSLVLRLCVRVVRQLIARGILRWDLLSLQSLLRSNRGNRGSGNEPLAFELLLAAAASSDRRKVRAA